MTPRVRLLGLDFCDIDADAAAALLAERRREEKFGYVVTPNADHLTRLARDPSLRPVYAGAAAILLDSRVVAGAARLLGLRAPRVATGSDVTAALLLRHVAPGERLTIVGLSPARLPALIERTGIAPPAHHDPPKGFERDATAMAAAVAFVLANPARFVLLAVGSPRQERLAAAIAATGRATGLGLCVGASLDFLSGARARAPRWMQVAGLEWLHRLSRDPARMARRYLIDDPPVFALLLRERLARGPALIADE